MGCYDMYCKVCGAPFTPYQSTDFPQMEGVDTNWLGEVIVEYSNGDKVYATGYDSYGRFTSVTTGKIVDVGLAACDSNLKVYHKLCEGNKTPSNKFRIYQQQHFDIFTMIANNRHHLLDKSYNK
jgi:hypothetical protein